MRQRLLAYYRLARFDKPVGILLLWVPTAWALWLANLGHPSLKLVLLFFCGTILMRAAGCVINDMADRRIDCHVQRTKNRPLTSGAVSLFEASCLVLGLLLGALWILYQLPSSCIIYAIAALIITVIYPFCKRYIHAPQLVLGLAFSMGIPMAYVASGVNFNWVFWCLCLLNFLWIMAYDTEYAMVDKPDDQQIGVHSTAIFFGSYDRCIVLCLLAIVHLFWFMLAILLKFNGIFYIGWSMAAALLIKQVHLSKTRNGARLMQAFMLNAWYGLMMWVVVVLSCFLSA